MSESLPISSLNVAFPDRTAPATVTIKNDRILAIGPYQPEIGGIDLGPLALLPGVVDPHVHFNEPGRTEWEGWDSGSRAAIAGGVTTVVDMPLNCIPSTVDAESFELKHASLSGKLSCDVGFWGGAVPGNLAHLRPLYEKGVLGFKCFLSDPGTAEFQNIGGDDLRRAMDEIAALDSVLLVHAEWPPALRRPDPDADPKNYSSWLHTRPVEAETEAVREMVRLSRETGCRCHIVHVSSAEVLTALEGSEVTCETCAHYLAFCAEEISDGATNFKCAPPIRERRHQESLWQALKEGRIQMVTSDHSPCPGGLKNDDFLASWGGIAGVQMLLSATWTGAEARGIPLNEMMSWLSAAPARLAGLDRDLGSIEVGKLANLVVFDPRKEFECDSLFHRHGGSPYQGRTWKGVVEQTYLRGVSAYHQGTHESPSGRFLSRV